MIEISPAGLQTLHIVLEKELLIIKLLVSALLAVPALLNWDSAWLSSLPEWRGTCLYDLKQLLFISTFSPACSGSAACCVLIFIAAFCLRPPLSFSSVRPSLQVTPNRLFGVKLARWLLTCGALQSCHSSRVTGRCVRLFVVCLCSLLYMPCQPDPHQSCEIKPQNTLKQAT